MIFHLEESKIEKFVLEPEIFNDIEKNEIITHLNNCITCKEIYDTFNHIYMDLTTGLKRSVTSNDEEVARRIYQRLSNNEEKKLLPAKSTTVQIYDGKTEIIERPKIFSLEGLRYYFNNYPLQFSGLSIISLLVIVLLFVSINKNIKDDNPVYADIKNGVLNIYNSNGEVLWGKTAFGISEVKNELLFDWNFPIKKHINIGDIDSDNKNEVLISGDFKNQGFFRSDSLYCFNSDGTKRWVTGPEDIYSKIIPDWKRTGWFIQDFFIVNGNGKKKLFVIANDIVYAMTIISEIDPSNGKVVSSLYHSGWFFTKLVVNLKNDLDDIIIIGATSNDYYKPVVMILKTGNFRGAIDKNELFSKNNIRKANPLYYILLPITNFHERLSLTVVANVQQIEKTNKGFIVTTNEVPDQKDYAGAGIVYSFGEKMQVKNIIPTNSFQKLYNDLYKKGVFREQLDSTYFNNLKNSILYWDGDKFFNYPTKNKYWNQKF